jgi:hypothetical protein
VGGVTGGQFEKMEVPARCVSGTHCIGNTVQSVLHDGIDCQSHSVLNLLLWDFLFYSYSLGSNMFTRIWELPKP